jgi:hypothetical protein
MLQPVNQIAIGNKFHLSGASESNKDDSIELSHKVYFTHAVTTSQAYRFKTLGVRKKSTLRKFFRARMALPR